MLRSKGNSRQCKIESSVYLIVQLMLGVVLIKHTLAVYAGARSTAQECERSGPAGSAGQFAQFSTASYL